MLTNKTALITGSNRGIGFSILENFAKHGCNIYAHSRKESEEFKIKTKKIALKYGVEINHISFDQTAFIYFTSGSTGTSKGIMVSHINIISDVFAQKKHLYDFTFIKKEKKLRKIKNKLK